MTSETITRTFAQVLALLPFSASQTDAQGVFAPFIRAMGHLLYLVADLHRETPLLTEEEQRNEALAAAGHLANTAAAIDQTPGFTTAARLQMGFFIELVAAFASEFEGYSPDDRKANALAAAHRAAGLAAAWDLELLGRPGADPGLSL